MTTCGNSNHDSRKKRKKVRRRDKQALNYATACGKIASDGTGPDCATESAAGCCTIEANQFCKKSLRLQIPTVSAKCEEG